MARYNFADPNQANEFRQKAISAGYDTPRIEKYIQNQQKQALESQKMQLDTLKTQKELEELRNPSSAVDAKGEFQRKIINARSASQNALDILETGGEIAGPITTRVGEVAEFFGLPGKGTDYRAAINLASTQLFNALAGTTQTEVELRRLEKLMPKDTDQEATAKRKLEMLTGMLDDQAKIYGIDIEAAMNRGEQPQDLTFQDKQPAFNIRGEVAEEGDLILDSKTGSLSIYGQQPAETVFKRTDEGADIDNGLIKWLADSDFLPIAGSIAGGIMGAGWGSVVTGAAGAVVGKALQQGLRELFDPEAQDLSTAAKAVLIEGMTDAIIGGATFGIGKIAVKGGKAGLKIIFGKGAGELAEQGFKTIAKEGVEEGSESAIKKVIKGQVQKEFGITKSMRKQYRNAFGSNLVDDITEKVMQSGAKNLDEFADESSKNFFKSQAELAKKISGKQVNKAEVLEELNKIRKTMFIGDVPKGGTSAAVNTLDEFIDEIKAYDGKTFDAKYLQDIKSRLGETVFSSASEIKAGKETLARAQRYLRKYIENYDETIAGTNKEIFLNKTMSDISTEALDKPEVIRMFGGLGDLIFGGVSFGTGSPMPYLLNKGYQVINSQLDVLERKTLFENAIKTAAGMGNKNAVRGILRLMWRTGVGFSATQYTNMDMQEQPQQPGMGIDDAFTPEGVPLYK